MSRRGRSRLRRVMFLSSSAMISRSDRSPLLHRLGICGRAFRGDRLPAAAGEQHRDRAAEREPPAHSFTPRKRNAFVMTDTELKLIAAAAIIGLSNTPKNG